MRSFVRLAAPLVASAALAMGLVGAGFVGGLGPTMAGSAEAAAAVPHNDIPCNKPVDYQSPRVASNDKSVIFTASKCLSVTAGSTPETLVKTCTEVYNTNVGGWVIGAYGNEARGTACNNSKDGNVRYGVTKRYVSYDKYRAYLVIIYQGVTYKLHGPTIIIHTT